MVPFLYNNIETTKKCTIECKDSKNGKTSLNST